MQPRLTTKEGNVIPLTDEAYEAILKLMGHLPSAIEPAESVDQLEEEFAELFADSASTDELLGEHRTEAEREDRKLGRFE